MRIPPALRHRLRLLDVPTTALAAWGAFLLATQRWPSWGEGIRLQFAADASSYEAVARAAPAFPQQRILRPFAERFPAHWLVGVVSDAGVPLHLAYRIGTTLCVALTLLATHLALRRLGLGGRAHAVALGALAASAYPVHYLLAAPGMLTDALFLLGLAVTALGFAGERFPVVLTGLALATVGRQTAVPVGVAAAAAVFLVARWHRRRWGRALACALVPAAIYVVLHELADPFATRGVGGLDEISVIGFLDGPGDLAGHLGRVALGLAVPAAAALGAWRRSRATVLQPPLLLAAAVALQPIVLGPASNGSNEPRLAGLAAPALAVAAGAFLRSGRLSARETWVLVAAIALGGLHHRYTQPGLQTNVAWATVELAAAAVVLAVLARPAQGIVTARLRRARTPA